MTGARTAVTNGSLTGYLGFDLHGNTALAENAAKVITDALRYDAWGELIASTTSALPTPWRYQGRLDVGPDAANPLYDFGARDYRPVTGAFTSLDSYAGAVLDPLSMNRFLYAEANPATFVDPDGHGVDTGIGNCMPTCPTDVKAAAAAAQAAAAAAKASSAADDRESVHIVMRAGGAVTGPVVPYGPEWQRLTDACAYGDRWSASTQAACNVVSPDALGGLIGTVAIAFGAAACAAICPEAGVIGATVGRVVAPATAAVKDLWDRFKEAVSASTPEFRLPPVVSSAGPKLQALADKFHTTAEDLYRQVDKFGTRYVDLRHDGNINILLQRTDTSGFIRITVDPTGQRIISAGLMQASQVLRLIENGVFNPMGPP